MDIEIKKKDGKTYRLSDYGLVKDIIIESPEVISRSIKVPGRTGSLDYGVDFGDKKIKVVYKFKHVDSIDYANMRDFVYGVLVDFNSYYIREMRASKPWQYDFVDFGKRPTIPSAKNDVYVSGYQYEVRLTSALSPEQFYNGGEVELEFTTAKVPYGESVYSTLQLYTSKYTSDVDTYGLVDGIHEDYVNQYKYTDPTANLLKGVNVALSSVTNAVNKYKTDGYTSFTTNGEYSGILLNPDFVKPNTTYTLQYKYKKLSGTLVGFGGHTDATWSNNKVYVDGKLITVPYNTNTSVFVADDTNEHIVRIEFTTGATVNVTQKIYIQPNRGSTTAVTVEVYDIQMVEGTTLSNTWRVNYDDNIKSSNPQLLTHTLYIWNAGTAVVEPETMFLNIEIGFGVSHGNMKVKNVTTGETSYYYPKDTSAYHYRWYGYTFKKSETLALRDTNKQFIRLAPGLNKINISNVSFKTVIFDFKFYNN